MCKKYVSEAAGPEQLYFIISIQHKNIENSPYLLYKHNLMSYIAFSLFPKRFTKKWPKLADVTLITSPNIFQARNPF